MASNHTSKLFGGALCAAGIVAAAASTDGARAQCAPTAEGGFDGKAFVDGHFPPGGGYASWGGMAVNGDRLYAGIDAYADNGTGYYEWQPLLGTWDISDPTAPTLLGISPVADGSFVRQLEEEEPGSGAVALGDILVGVQGGISRELHFYSMADPTDPQLVSTLDLPGFEHGIIEYEGLLHVRSDNTLYVIDAADPQDPVIVGSAAISIRWGAPVDDILPTVSTTTLTLLDVGDPTNITTIATLPVPSNIASATIIGNAVIMPTFADEFHVVDIFDPSNPTTVGTFDLGTDVQKLDASGAFGYGVDGRDVVAFDFSNPGTPIIASTLVNALRAGDAGDPDRQLLSGGLLTVSHNENDGEWADLHIFDVSECAVLPTVTYSPTARIVEPGGPDEILTIIADSAFAYQWFKDGAPLADDGDYAGTQTPSLTVPAATFAEGVYTCEISNTYGMDVSLPTIVAVREDPNACTADINGDGIVDTQDLLGLMGAWGMCP